MKVLPSVPLPSMTGGINRFVDEAREDQTIDALNVVEQAGALVRRPAFMPIATNAPFHLPAGGTSVLVENPAGVYTSYTHRNPTINVANTLRFYVGSIQPFDGFTWAQVSSTPSPANVTNNARSRIAFIDGDGNDQPIYGHVDTTVKHVETGSTSFYITLFQNGRISWNRALLSGWALRTINSLSRYWVVITLADVDNTPDIAFSNIAWPVSSGNIVIVAGGIKTFLLNPVNGIIPTRSKGRAPVTILGSDTVTRRGNIVGGGVGFHTKVNEKTKIAKLSEYEGAGIFNTASHPNWGGGSTTLGSAFTLTKDRRDYSWQPGTAIAVGQHDGAPLLRVVATAAASNSTIPVASGWEGSFNRDFSGHRAVIVDGQVGGPPEGEEREIWRSNASATLIEVYPNWTLPLIGGEIFEIRRQPAFVDFAESSIAVDGNYEIDTNAEHTALVIKNEYADAYTLGPSGYINFNVGRECFWVMSPGFRWRSAFDSSTGATILTNGENGLLEFDGRRLRPLAALFDVTEGVPGARIVQLWRGIVADLVLRHNDPKLEEGSQVRASPPNGRYIVDFMGRLVVANIREREQTLQWSAPGFFNGIWPLTYETQVRDSENNPITGLATLDDSLFVFTKTAIFKAPPAGERGELYFTPISQGVGFVSNEAVVRVLFQGQSALVGVTPDGISATVGGPLSTIVDDWRRYLPDGVNVRGLENAVAGVWMNENLMFFAVPSSGSTGNDRLIVVDYSANPGKIWLWSCPDPITSIAHDFDEAGTEVVLFGHLSGHISTLAETDWDFGGQTVTAYARTKTVTIPDGIAGSFAAVLLRLQAVGNFNVSATPYVNGSGVSAMGFGIAGAIEMAGAPNDGIYGTHADNSLYDTGRYGTGADRTYRQNLPTGTVGEEFEMEIRFTRRFKYRGATLLSTSKGQRGF